MSVSASYFEDYKNDKQYGSGNGKKQRIPIDYKAVSAQLGWAGNGKRIIFKYDEKNTPILFSHSFIDVPFQITTNANGNIDDTDIVMVINNAYSKFNRMVFKINGDEINSINENWLVQHLCSLGLYSNRYANAILEDEMDFVVDKERLCREFYGNSMVNDNALGITQNFGLFDEVRELSKIGHFRTHAIDVNFTVRIILDVDHVDIGKIHKFYNGWFIEFGSEVHDTYKNKLFVISDCDVYPVVAVGHADYANNGKFYLEFAALPGAAGNFINPFDGTDVLIGTGIIAADSAKQITISLHKPYDQKHEQYFSSAAKRSLKYHKSKINYKRLPLALSNLLPHQWLDRIVGGLPNWSIELEYVDDNRILFHNQVNKTFKHVIPIGSDPKLYVCYANLSSSSPYSQMYYENLLNGKQILDMNKFHVESNTYSSNKVAYQIVGIQSLDSIPLYLFVAFHNNTGIIGGGTKLDSQLYNPLIFDNLGIREIHLVIGTYQYPAVTEKINLIKPITASDDPIRFPLIWNYFLQSYDKNLDFESDGVSGLTKQQFLENNSIFCFDLESQNFRESLRSSDSTLNVRVEADLAKNTDYTIFCCSVVKKQLELDYKNGVATMPY